MGKQNYDDGLMSGGARSFKFDRVGDKISGRVESVERKQITDITTGEPKTWADGSPIWQFIFTLTCTPDPDDIADDGQRRIFAKNKMLTAIRTAIRTSGCKGSAVGGVLSVKYSGTEPSKTKGFSPTKLFMARFEPPAARDDLMDDVEDSPKPVSTARASESADDDIPF